MDKERILKNVGSLNEEELLNALRSGTVTLYELSKTGDLSPVKRRRLENMLAADPGQPKRREESVIPPPPDTPVVRRPEGAAAPETTETPAKRRMRHPLDDENLSFEMRRKEKAPFEAGGKPRFTPRSKETKPPQMPEIPLPPSESDFQEMRNRRLIDPLPPIVAPPPITPVSISADSLVGGPPPIPGVKPPEKNQ